MKINGKEYLNPQEQLFENTKDIEELKQVIKPEYTTSASLTEASVTVALNTTNAPEGTTEGWLLTHDGLKFKITGGDETNLLLEFYANLKGPQGEDGAAVNIDDSTTANNKVWSSNKVNTEVGKAKDKGIYFTTTQPTEDSGLYYLNEGHFENTSYDIPIKAFDLLIYIDGDDKASEIYKVLSKTGDNWSLDKLGDIGGGKKTYQHHITAKGTGSFSANVIIALTIKNEDDTEFTALTLRQYLYNNGFIDVNHLYDGGGRFGTSSPYGALVGLYATASTIMAYTTNDSSDYISISEINDIVL